MTDLEIATTVLTAFWREMNAWEREAQRLSKAMRAGQMSQEEARARAAQMLQAIYARFVETPIEGSRVTLRPWCVPPEHNPDEESIVSVEREDNLLIAWTRGRASRLVRDQVYTLVPTDNGWRIRDNRMGVESDGALDPWDL
jgi:hypothetical protein